MNLCAYFKEVAFLESKEFWWWCITLKVTVFEDFVHSLEFWITRKHNILKTGYIYETLFFSSYLEFWMMDKVLKSSDSRWHFALYDRWTIDWLWQIEFISQDSNLYPYLKKQLSILQLAMQQILQYEVYHTLQLNAKSYYFTSTPLHGTVFRHKVNSAILYSE
jgi:hypothetical protein